MSRTNTSAANAKNRLGDVLLSSLSRFSSGREAKWGARSSFRFDVPWSIPTSVSASAERRLSATIWPAAVAPTGELRH
eukprot:scaffold733_cov267-Pinguiococcus_pyrenoidosus.AAC.47